MPITNWHDEEVLNLAERIESLLVGRRFHLPPRPGFKRSVCIERTSDGFAAWAIGRANGLLVQDPVDMAEIVVTAFEEAARS